MSETRRQSSLSPFRHLPVGVLLRGVLLSVVIALGAIAPVVPASASAQSGGSQPGSGVEDGDGPIGGGVAIDDNDAASTPAGYDVKVKKWICPPGTMPGKPLETYFRLCDPAFRQFVFSLAGSGGVVSQTTESGTATWSGLPSGPVSITETVPNKYGEPFVYCLVYEDASLSAQASPVEFVTSEGETVEVDLDIPDVELICYWFNVESPLPRG